MAATYTLEQTYNDMLHFGQTRTDATAASRMEEARLGNAMEDVLDKHKNIEHQVKKFENLVERQSKRTLN